MHRLPGTERRTSTFASRRKGVKADTLSDVVTPKGGEFLAMHLGGTMAKIISSAGLAIVLAVFTAGTLTPADQPASPTAFWTEGGPEPAEFSAGDYGVVKVRDLPVPEGTNGFYLNVMQDCWTTDIEEVMLDPELENYLLTPDNVVFVWKHKIFEPCENYIATVVGLPCEDGKPPIIRRIAWVVPDFQFGFIEPGAEYLFWLMVPGIPVGNWDWFVVTECNDTNGMITPPLKDGDIDDVIGANLGVVTYPPLVYGPEPAEVLDPDPGGFPPGRRPGEEGSCRCWCFTVEETPQCPSMEGTWDLYFNWFEEPGEVCEDSLGIGLAGITFFADGTFTTTDGGSGTWTQDNCDVDWVFDNSTHYWGVMTTDGSFMEGEMLSLYDQEGCWWGYRNKGTFGGPQRSEPFTASGNRP
jgi:hypothetical protein